MPSGCDLDELIRSMAPELVDGEFVFVTAPSLPDGVDVLATVREEEGRSCVIGRDDADRLGLGYDFVAAWITLRVHSALDAVGLTAAVSGALARAGISCNVIAGRHHDHLLVPHHAAAEAMARLTELARTGVPSDA